MESVGYLILSLIGLGILIFFHELGHYIVARRVGMTVEVFAIGFGRPILQWEVKGVRWQLGWIPFGGYVKIKGSEPKGDEPLDTIPDGFFGKNQRFNRIKVALAGPLVNFALALLFFFFIWLGGGRARPFADSTQIIGYVPPKSALYTEGLRAGDKITHVAGREYRGYMSLIESAMTNSGSIEVRGYKAPSMGSAFSDTFSYQVDLAMNTDDLSSGRAAQQIPLPASYLMIRKGVKNSPLTFSGSPFHTHGIKEGDRLLWVDGAYVYSHGELTELLQAADALLSVERGGKHHLVRVPRLFIGDLALSEGQKDDIMDLRYDSGLKEPLHELRALPCELSQQGEVIALLNHLEEPLLHGLHLGDRIIAVDTNPVFSSLEIFKAVQSHAFRIAVQRSPELKKHESSTGEDGRFEAMLKRSEIAEITEALARGEVISTSGDVTLLEPITTKPLAAFAKTAKEQEDLAGYIEQQKERAQGELSPEKRSQILSAFDEQLRRPMLGLAFQDKLVYYNPSPFAAFYHVFSDTWHTLKALVAGPLSPKLLSGPVGIIQIMQGGFSTSWAEGLFWMALISVNLGVLNLLPIPVLDGGHICFAIYEIVTGKTISPRTMQRLTIPFAVLLIAFLIWVTLQDIGRFFG